MILLGNDNSSTDNDTKLRSDWLLYVNGQMHRMKNHTKHRLWKLIFHFSCGFLTIFLPENSFEVI